MTRKRSHLLRLLPSSGYAYFSFLAKQLRVKVVLQAVEVASPNSTLEMTIKTAMPKHTAIPKGRLNWPREAKAKGEDRILVFAEGRQAEEAKRAGADVVGGLELVDGVGSQRRHFHSYY